MKIRILNILLKTLLLGMVIFWIWTIYLGVSSFIIQYKLNSWMELRSLVLLYSMDFPQAYFILKFITINIVWSVLIVLMWIFFVYYSRNFYKKYNEFINADNTVFKNEIPFYLFVVIFVIILSQMLFIPLVFDFLAAWLSRLLYAFFRIINLWISYWDFLLLLRALFWGLSGLFILCFISLVTALNKFLFIKNEDE